MANDYLLYWMTQPTGLLAIGVAIALLFFVWRLALGAAITKYGYWPPAIASLATCLALLLTNYISAHIDFSQRVAKNLLPEIQRWSLTLDWALNNSMLAVVFLLPLLGFVAVPLTARLLKKQKLTVKNITVVLVLGWLAMALIGWLAASDIDWHAEHRMQSLGIFLFELFTPIVFIGGAFLFTVLFTARRKNSP